MNVRYLKADWRIGLYACRTICPWQLSSIPTDSRLGMMKNINFFSFNRNKNKTCSRERMKLKLTMIRYYEFFSFFFYDAKIIHQTLLALKCFWFYECLRYWIQWRIFPPMTVIDIFHGMRVARKKKSTRRKTWFAINWNFFYYILSGLLDSSGFSLDKRNSNIRSSYEKKEEDIPSPKCI